MNYLEKLNPAQRGAVECTDGPLMIIAGAGSGKTRVITYRIAHLVGVKKVDSFSILALTFTNKSAREMRERISTIIGPEARNIWMGTFHSVFARILRVEADKLGYPSNFTIYDTDDSKSLLRAIVKELQLDDKLYNVNFVLNRISSAKNNLISPAEYRTNTQVQSDDRNAGRLRMADIYETYAQRCFRAGAMDFDDLLYKTNVLLKQFPDVLEKYQRKFKYVMVDEYQDTNFSQYIIVKKLAAATRNICVVGDDAQSIYSFRGANIENILNFEKDYPELNVFKLEQNYRSTQNIVNIANSIIKHNKNQLKKSIFSDNAIGDKIRVMRAFSDNEEGKLVAESIIDSHNNEGLDYKSFAILYRTNAQSRSMEEALRKSGIPYKIYGGMSFYQRKEIKDLIAYFRLTVNPNDEEALKRVINYPVRGIGKTSMDKIFILADEKNLPLWEIVANINLYINGRGVDSILSFANMIKGFQVLAKTNTAYELAEHVAKNSGILRELHSDKSIEGLNRYENIQELLNGMKEFSEREDIEDRSINPFLQDVALLTGDEKKEDENKNTVSLMTIHSSKGLEFPHVFVVGLEENLFPSQMAVNSRTELEEERRLFYVASTRAESKLTYSYATSRFKFGTLNNSEPSRFLDEVDPKFLDLDFNPVQKKKEQLESFADEREGFREFASKPKPMSKLKTTQILPKAHTPTEGFTPDDTSKLQAGMEVEHERFGFGKVINLEGNKPDQKATIFFTGIGQKQLLLKFAKLRIVSGEVNMES